MRVFRNGITNEEVKRFIEDLQSNVGNYDKIDELLENHELVVAYLEKIGVNPEWLDKILVVENAKEKMRIMLGAEESVITEKGIESESEFLGVIDDKFYIEKNKKRKRERYVTNISKKEKGYENATLEYIVKDERYGLDLRSILDEYGIEQVRYSYDEDGKVFEKEERQKDSCEYKITTFCKGIGKILRRKNETILDDGYGYEFMGRNNDRMVELLRRYPEYKKWLEGRGVTLTSLIEDLEGKIERFMPEFSEEERENCKKNDEYIKKIDLRDRVLRKIDENGYRGIYESKLRRVLMNDPKRLEDELARLDESFKMAKMSGCETEVEPIYESREEIESEARKRAEERIKKLNISDFTDEEKRYMVVFETTRVIAEYNSRAAKRENIDDATLRVDEELKLIGKAMPTPTDVKDYNARCKVVEEMCL